MTWSRIIRLFAVVVLVSGAIAVATAAHAGDAWTWSDRLGFGAFAMMIGAGTVAMVWGNGLEDL